MQYYTIEELVQIVKRTARVLNTAISDEAAYEIAKRSRGTPRIANKLLRRVHDFALVDQKEEIDLEITRKALDRLKIDALGLDETDKELLLTIIDKFRRSGWNRDSCYFNWRRSINN